MAFNNLIDLDRLERFLGKLKLLLDGKVDKETGKGLSTEDFTTAEKTKLAGIESGAKVNVQPDWSQAIATADDFIKNKPANLVQDASYVHTDNNYTNSEKTKLSGIAEGAEVNVQPDWNQTTSTADDYIKNKPSNLVQDASYVHTDNNYTTAEKTKLDGIENGAEANVQSDWNQITATADDYIKNKPTLGTAAALDAPSSGNAANNEVVLGSDSRLTDARNASDVYAWAKASAKPSYTANEVGAIPATDKGVSNGVAELDENGHVPSSQLPSYVDDVVEGYYYQGSFYQNEQHTTGYIPESGKIYVDLTTNKTYRWGGTAYATISSDLALGETSSTAYRGDHGKTAYDDSQTNKANIGTMANLTTTEKSSLVGAVNEIDSELADKVDKITGKGLSTEDYTTAEKTKLSGIEAGAQVNVIESVKVNGTALTPDGSNAVNVTVPTKTSDLTNDDNVVKDANYTHTDSNYTAAEKTKLAGIEAQANKTVIDDTLTEAGQAADAKEVGDQLDDVRQTISGLSAISGVAVQTTEPDEGINVWINPDDSQSLSIPGFDITGDGDLDNSFTATNLTEAANELKSQVENLNAGDVSYSGSASYSSGSVGNEVSTIRNTLNQLEDGLAIPQTGNTASRSIPANAFIFLTGNTNNLADGIYQNTSGSAIGSGATFTLSNLTMCYQDTGALNTLSASIENAKIDVKLNLRRNYVLCGTTLEIENAVAAQVASMGSTSQSSIIGINVSQTGQKLSGGIWNGIIFKGDGSYYSVLFYTYQNFLRQYIYLNGTKSWYQYNPSAI